MDESSSIEEVDMEEETNEEIDMLQNLRISDGNKDPNVTFTHLHYLGWPDFGAPSNTEHIISLVKDVRNLINKSMKNKERKINVVSSSGSTHSSHLAKYISAESEVDAVEMHEPYTYLNGLTTEDLEDLLEDIKVYQRLEKGANADFWEDITVIVEDELNKLRKLDSKTGSIYEAAMERREGINKAVARDVQGVFKGKTVEQLDMLQKSIESKLKERAEGVDIGYWESLLSQLKAHSARGRLKDKHHEKLRNKLAELKAETLEAHAGIEGVEAATSEEAMEVEETEVKEKTPSDRGSRAGSVASGSEAGGELEDWEVEANTAMADFRTGGYSPQYTRLEDLDPGTVTFLEEEDVQRRNFDQQKALKGAKVNKPTFVLDPRLPLTLSFGHLTLSAELKELYV